MRKETPYRGGLAAGVVCMYVHCSPRIVFASPPHGVIFLSGVGETRRVYTSCRLMLLLLKSSLNRTLCYRAPSRTSPYLDCRRVRPYYCTEVGSRSAAGAACPSVGGALRTPPHRQDTAPVHQVDRKWSHTFNPESKLQVYPRPKPLKHSGRTLWIIVYASASKPSQAAKEPICRRAPPKLISIQPRGF